MVKHSFLLAFTLGVILPWILFAGKESSVDISEPESTASIVDEQGSVEETILVGSSDGTIAKMDLEQYVVGVVIGEMPDSFDLEALKAQAVVSRTFAFKSIINSYKHTDFAVCTDSSCCQGYYAPSDYVAAGGEVTKFVEAVEATRGQVLLYEDELIEATYFSCSGGRTEDAQAVWGTEVPYLKSQISPGEEYADHYTDTVIFSAEEFQKLMGQEFTGPPGGWLGSVTYTNGGGVDSVQIGDFSYSGMQVRQKLGLHSTAFVMSAVGNRITITTKGFGHRVGMSQYGADAMAVQGSSYQQILSYYYPGTVLDFYRNV